MESNTLSYRPHPQPFPLKGYGVHTNKMVQGLLTPAFRPGIKGRENQWGFSPKHNKSYDFMKKYGFKRTAG
jgi:hypothetical protein